MAAGWKLMGVGGHPLHRNAVAAAAQELQRYDKLRVMKKSASRPLPATKQGPRPEPIRDSEEVQQNEDKHIDQDFPGYPHPPSHISRGRTIHNGSAGAFDATEHSHDEDDNDQDSDDFAMDT